MACTCRHYACTCSHYTGTTQSAGTIQVSEQLLAIWKRDAYLRSCTYAQRRIHFLIPQQKELSEQVNSMKMIFTLNLKKQQERFRSNIEIVPVYRKCVDRYCHKRTIQKAMHEKAQSASIEDVMAKPKRARRSEQQFFSFLQ